MPKLYDDQKGRLAVQLFEVFRLTSQGIRPYDEVRSALQNIVEGKSEERTWRLEGTTLDSELAELPHVKAGPFLGAIYYSTTFSELVEQAGLELAAGAKSMTALLTSGLVKNETFYILSFDKGGPKTIADWMFSVGFRPATLRELLYFYTFNASEVDRLAAIGTDRTSPKGSVSYPVIYSHGRGRSHQLRPKLGWKNDIHASNTDFLAVSDKP